jgi:hypothetical protein
MRSGFLLIDLVVACALLLILTYICMPSINFIHPFIAKVELTLLKNTVQCAQWKAIATGTDQTIKGNIKDNSYTFEGTIKKISSPFHFGTGNLIKGPPSSPHTSITNVFTFVNQQIKCFKTGIISAGTIYISSLDNQLCFALSNPIAHQSHIRIYEYKNDIWKMMK